MGRSILAISAAMLVMLVIVSVYPIVLLLLMDADQAKAMWNAIATGESIEFHHPGNLFFMICLVIDIMVASLAAWIMCKILSHDYFRHGVILATILLVLGVISLVGEVNVGMPVWYPSLRTFLAPLAVLAVAKGFSAGVPATDAAINTHQTD